MKTDEFIDYITFIIGLALLIGNVLIGYNLPMLLLGIFLIYFSEVILEFFKLKKHQRDLKAIKKQTKSLKNMTKEEKEEREEERKEKGKKYESVMDKWEKEKKARKKWAKKHPILNFFLSTFETLQRVLWYRVAEYPHDIKWYITKAYQRAIRGWAVSDAWGFDWYLSRVIIEGCEWLKKNKHGVPMSAFKDIEATGEYGNHSDEEFKKASKNWDNILNKIIKTFKTTQKIQDSHWYYQKSETYSNKEATKIRGINKKMRKGSSDLWKRNDLHVMTKKECIEYEEGWKFFQEHYFSLWD